MGDAGPSSGDGNNGDEQPAPAHSAHASYNSTRHVPWCLRHWRTRSKEKKKEKKIRAEMSTFRKHYYPDPREEPKDTAIVGNITKLLPANTFLMFQTLAPLATNQGVCHRNEMIMTSVLLVVLASACAIVIFTDTFQHNGKVYHGIVTKWGLWNPAFKGDSAFKDLRKHEHEFAEYYDDWERYQNDTTGKEPEKPVIPRDPYVKGPIYSSGTPQFEVKSIDFLHAVLSVAAFATITLLTAPVTTCFYPDIPNTVVKTTPLLVWFVVSAVFAFTPPARNGVAHPLSPGKTEKPDPNGKDGAASSGQQGGDQNSKDDNGSQVNTAATSSDKDDAPTQDLQKGDPALSPQANKAHEGNPVVQPAPEATSSVPAKDDASTQDRNAQISTLLDLIQLVGTNWATLEAPALAAALHGQGLQSFNNIHQVLQPQSAEAQGSNDQGQTMQQPAVPRVASIIAHLLSGVPALVLQAATGHLVPMVASKVVQEVGNLFVEGADHGVAGVRHEMRRAFLQGLGIPPTVTSFTEGVKSLEHQGSQRIKGAQDESTLSVAIDILPQQGSRAFNGVRSQLQRQESATAQGLNALFHNFYEPANDALSVYLQNMDGARRFATGLIQDPHTSQRLMSVLAQGPVPQFQQTVDQIQTNQPKTDPSLVGSGPVQQVAVAQEAGPSGLLTLASQSVSSFADSTGEGFKEGVDNVVLVAQTAKLSIGAELRESSTQLAEPRVLASTSEASDRQAEKGKSQMSEISGDASDPTLEITSDVSRVVDVNAGPLKVHVEVHKSTN